MQVAQTVLNRFAAQTLFGGTGEFRIYEKDGDLYVRLYDSPEDTDAGATLFFERANLPYIVEAMEQYLDPDETRKVIEVIRGKDNFGISTATPTKAHLAIALDNNRTATIDGLFKRIWSLYVEYETAVRLKDELKKLL